VTHQDFTPEERARLHQLAKRAAEEQDWAAALDEPGSVGNVARYLQSLDDAVRDLAPELTEDLRNEVMNSWIDESDWHEGVDHPLDLYTFVVAYRSALVNHDIVVPPAPEEPFPDLS
jgi:hypothetical protein